MFQQEPLKIYYYITINLLLYHQKEIIEEFYQVCLAQQYIAEGGIGYAKELLEKACALEENTLRPSGYGILKDGRCVGRIAPPQAQGVNLLCGLGGHGDVRLGDATVTLSACKTEIQPRWNGDTLAGLKITLRLRAALTETDGRRDDTAEAARARLEAALARTVQGWCEGILRQSQALGADFLDLAGHIRRDNPSKWSRIAPEWSAILPELPWTVTVEATLDRTLDLEAPVPLGGTE